MFSRTEVVHDMALVQINLENQSALVETKGAKRLPVNKIENWKTCGATDINVYKADIFKSIKISTIKDGISFVPVMPVLFHFYLIHNIEHFELSAEMPTSEL